MNRYIHEKLYNMIYLEGPMRSYQWEPFENDLEDMQTVGLNANQVHLTKSVIVTSSILSQNKWSFCITTFWSLD